MLQRAVQVRTRFLMDCNVLHAGFCQAVYVYVGMFNHQMGVEGNGNVLPQGGDDRHAERQVRHEMAVHHVEMDAVCSL